MFDASACYGPFSVCDLAEARREVGDFEVVRRDEDRLVQFCAVLRPHRTGHAALYVTRPDPIPVLQRIAAERRDREDRAMRESAAARSEGEIEVLWDGTCPACRAEETGGALCDACSEQVGRDLAELDRQRFLALLVADGVQSVPAMRDGSRNPVDPGFSNGATQS